MKVITTSDYTKVEPEQCEILKKVQDAITNGQASISVLNDKSIFASRKVNVISTKFSEMMTQNYVGVLHYKTADEEVTVKIMSRFDKNDPSQQFLNYMLQKVGDENVHVSHALEAFVGKDTLLKHLFFLRFMELLQLAHKKGIYRQYRSQQYRDSKFKGTLDINRYIKNAGLKDGNIPYNVRERVVDNPINILILQAYEKMLKDGDRHIHKIIEHTPTVRQYIQQLKNEIPTYQSYDLHKLLKETQAPIGHPYYTVINELRKVARDIVMNRGIEMFSSDRVCVHGVLLDVNVLWEQFVGVMLDQSPSMAQYKVKTQQRMNVLKLQQSSHALATIIPDILLYEGERAVIVLDAKHKLKWQQSVIDGEGVTSFREDIFQIVSYMNFLNCHVGGVIFPYSEEDEIVTEKLEGRMLSEIAPNKSFLTIPLRIMAKGPNFMADMDGECEFAANRLKETIQLIVQNHTEQLTKQSHDIVSALGISNVTPEQLATVQKLLAQGE